MKKLLKSKTFWSGLASIVTGIGLCVAENFPQGIPLIVVGVLAICGRDAIRKLEG